MRYFLIFLFAITSLQTINAQVDNSFGDINTRFKLNIDSVERKINIERWGTDTSYYLHFGVKNISIDTLIFITNTCFYYNHSLLKVENSEYDLNSDGDCYMNSYNTYILPPGNSFTESQSITAFFLNDLILGEWNMTLSIPIIKDEQGRFRVDGRNHVENKQNLIYTGKSKIIKTVEDYRKRKKKKCT